MAELTGSTRSSRSASGAASSSRPRRSTAASARPTTTATTACCSRTTSRPSGGGRCCRSATTSSRSTRRSSSTRKVWEASGHLAGFTDPLVQCLGKCKKRWREDHLREAARRRGRARASMRCPECGGELSEPRQFNLMFETHVGPVAGRGLTRSTCGPRPRRGSSSTSRTSCSSRARSRRSASPRSASPSATRSPPATSSSAPASSSRWRWSSSSRPPTPASGTSTGWRSAMRWYTDLGIRPDQLRLRAHGADELSHYSSATSRHRVPLPDGLVGARGDRQPRRLRPHPARQVHRREARVLRPADRRALRPARDRAGGRRRPRDARLHGRRLRRPRRSRGASAPCCASTPASPRSRSRCCRSSTRTGSPRRRARSTRSCAS